LDGEEESQAVKGLDVSGDDFLEGMLADVNGDGYDDLVMASPRSTSSERFVLWAALSTGDGFAEFTQVYESDQARAKSIYPGDFDGDGDDDIVLVDADGETTEMLTSDGAAYSSTWRGNNGGHNFDDAEVGDFDRDGTEELVFMSVFSGDNEQIAIARWADGRWQDEIWFTAKGKSLDLLYGNPGTAVADVDGDGRDDVIRFSNVAGTQPRTIWVLTSDGKEFKKAQDWGTYVCECAEYFDDATSGLP
ncbi:MAG: FG-GAP-like repeat-containing protein, partial [Nocardioidaceae bacterium]|nr:FG-GAP-like repeat-containing protein [Nocardioidaceae bacterium]